MLGFIREGKDFAGYCAADRVVGRAAAMLFVKAGVRAVFADVMSVGAERLLKAHGIETGCDTLADGILNRDKTGPCPMESAVRDTENIDDGALRIIKKADEMKNSGNERKGPMRITHRSFSLGICLREIRDSEDKAGHPNFTDFAHSEICARHGSAFSSDTANCTIQNASSVLYM